jgi:hypothetical protein
MLPHEPVSIYYSFHEKDRIWLERLNMHIFNACIGLIRRMYGWDTETNHTPYTANAAQYWASSQIANFPASIRSCAEWP